LTFAQRIDVWLGLLEFNQQLLLAGLRRKAGHDDAVPEAYRQWVRQAREEKDRSMIHLMQELDRRQREEPRGG
jgi:hypothetical protein